MADKQLHLVIQVAPTSKLRARTVQVRGGMHMTYTPAKTRNAENELKALLLPFKEQVNGFIPDKETPVYLEIIFYLEKPKTLPKRRTMPISKPDTDNYLKLAEDAIGSTLLQGDSQITTIVAKKRYGYPPRIELLLEVDSRIDCGKLLEVT